MTNSASLGTASEPIQTTTPLPPKALGALPPQGAAPAWAGGKILVELVAPRESLLEAWRVAEV